MLKPAPKAEETALLLGFVSRFCYAKLSRFGSFFSLSQNALTSVTCVTKLLDIVGNLCQVFGALTLKHHLSEECTPTKNILVNPDGLGVQRIFISKTDRHSDDIGQLINLKLVYGGPKGVKEPRHSENIYQKKKMLSLSYQAPLLGMNVQK